MLRALHHGRSRRLRELLAVGNRRSARRVPWRNGEWRRREILVAFLARREGHGRTETERERDLG